MKLDMVKLTAFMIFQLVCVAIGANVWYGLIHRETDLVIAISVIMATSIMSACSTMVVYGSSYFGIKEEKKC